MAKYGVNPFTGDIQIIPNKSNTIGGNDDAIILEQTELALEWVFILNKPYAEPTIYATQIGDKIQNEPAIVSTFWQHLENGSKLRIVFQNLACKGFVVVN